MNHHDANAKVVEDGDLLDEHTRRFGIGEYAPARFDHEGLALVHPDVRAQRS